MKYSSRTQTFSLPVLAGRQGLIMGLDKSGLSHFNSIVFWSKTPTNFESHIFVVFHLKRIHQQRQKSINEKKEKVYV